MHDIILAIFGVAVLLGLVSLMVPLARRLDMPYTVLLALFGAGLGFVVAADLQVDGIAGDFVAALRRLDLSAEAFLYLFLPPLLFAAGLGINVRRLMDDVGPVIVLAVFAVVVCTGVVGLVLSFVAPQYGILACLLLGSIVATTDSAAVVAIFRDIGAPARLSIIVEGESLFNDAAAIAIFVVLLGMLSGGETGINAGLGAFFIGLIGGLVTGYVLARVFAAIIGLLRDAALTEITLTVTLAYLAFIGAEVYLGVSGVIAVVTAAMVLNSEGRTRVTPGTWESMIDTWRLVEFIATSLIFTLAAMKAPAVLAGFSAEDFLIVVALFLATIAARAVVLYGVMPGLSMFRIAQPISGSYKAVMVWGGLRGAVTVALALAVAENEAIPEDVRSFILVSATGFVFMTLVVMAPTIRPLMAFFHLSALTTQDKAVRDRVLGLARARVRNRMRDVAGNLGFNGALSESLRSEFSEGNDAAIHLRDVPHTERRQFGYSVLAGREREFYMSYFQSGILNRRIADLLRTQTGRIIDAVKTHDNGPDVGDRYLQTAVSLLAIDRRFRLALWLYHRVGLVGPLSQAVSDRFEVLIISQLALRDLTQFVQSQLSKLVGEDIGADLERDLMQREQVVSGSLDALDLQYPSYAAMLRARYVERVALGFEHDEYQQQLDQAVISNEVFEDLEQDRLGRARRLEHRPTLDLGLRLSSLLQKVPLFAGLDDATLQALAKLLMPRIAVPGEKVIVKGTAGDCIYFVVAGAVDVVLPDTRIRLGNGDFFGEMALLTNEPRNADVESVGFSTLLMLNARDFQRLVRANPKLREQIEKTAEARKTAAH